MRKSASVVNTSGSARISVIRKAHRHIAVLFHQAKHRPDILGQRESGYDTLPSQQPDELLPSFNAQEVECFSDRGIAGAPGTRVLPCLLDGPCVVIATLAQQRD